MTYKYMIDGSNGYYYCTYYLRRIIAWTIQSWVHTWTATSEFVVGLRWREGIKWEVLVYLLWIYFSSPLCNICFLNLTEVQIMKTDRPHDLCKKKDLEGIRTLITYGKWTLKWDSFEMVKLCLAIFLHVSKGDDFCVKKRLS